MTELETACQCETSQRHSLPLQDREALGISGELTYSGRAANLFRHYTLHLSDSWSAHLNAVSVDFEKSFEVK